MYPSNLTSRARALAELLRKANPMASPVLAYLLHYTPDGEFSAEPMAIEGQVVVDEHYGVVLEIPLPRGAGEDDEQVVQIPVQQLRRSIRCLT